MLRKWWCEVDETVTEMTKIEESQAEPKVEEENVPSLEVLPTSRSSIEELDESR